MLVLQVVGAVGAAVDAVVGQIERGKHDNAVAVEVLLYLLCQPVDLLVFLLNVAVQQDGGVPVGEALSLFGLLQYFVYERFVVLVLLRKGQSFHDFLVIDKFIRVCGIYIIHFYILLTVSPSLWGSRSIYDWSRQGRQSPRQTATWQPVCSTRRDRSASPSADSAPVFSLLS